MIVVLLKRCSLQWNCIQNPITKSSKDQTRQYIICRAVVKQGISTLLSNLHISMFCYIPLIIDEELNIAVLVQMYTCDIKCLFALEVTLNPLERPAVIYFLL